jgi:N-acetyl-D-muramate 6-phosphate phosphatase
MKTDRSLQAVLFDLDGTLVDTAPDLVATLLHLRAQHGLGPMDAAELRHHAGRGALGLLEAGFAHQTDIDPSSLRQQFLDHYTANLWVHSRPFSGIEVQLEALQAAGIAMAVVTNKIESLARPVIEKAGWQAHFPVVVAGDTTARSKPDPAPVIEACRRLGVDPCCTLMVGDDRRDVQAGRGAGSATLVAAWGYLKSDESPEDWGADGVIDHPGQLEPFWRALKRGH